MTCFVCFQAMSDDSAESEKILHKAESKPWWLDDDESDNEIGDLNCFLVRFVFFLYWVVSFTHNPIIY